MSALSSAPSQWTVAIKAVGLRSWLGGVSYVNFLFRALRALPRERQPKLLLVIQDEKVLDLYQDTIQLSDGLLLVGEQFKPFASKLPPPSRCVDCLEDVNECADIVFPEQSVQTAHPAVVYWVCDFQHVHYPEFFNEEWTGWREKEFKFFAENAHTVVLSSEVAAQDFRRLYPASKAELRVLHFHFLVPPSCWQGDPRAVAERYKLPAKYLMCCNQFWMHKNHIRIFEAMARLKQRGIEIPVVFTGHQEDVRRPDFFPGLMEIVKGWGISNQMHLLGVIPREDQLQLLRGAVGVVQPSLFEGWSTVVEDSRALGKRCILSDIGVHREQAPPGAVYFRTDDSEALSHEMERMYALGSPGPDAAAELRAQGELPHLVRNYAESFLQLVERCRNMRNVSMTSAS